MIENPRHGAAAPRRTAIVGSIKFGRPDLVQRFVAGLPDGTVVVSGGAAGVDTIAEEAAKARSLPTIVFHAEWERLGRIAGPVRNRQIVDDAHEVVAFWNGISRGTLNTVLVALELGKLVRVIGEDGKDLTVPTVLTAADTRGAIAAFRAEDGSLPPEEALITGVLCASGDSDPIRAITAHFGAGRVQATVDRLDSLAPSAGWGGRFKDWKRVPNLGEYLRSRAVSALLAGGHDLQLLLGINAATAYALEIRHSFGGSAVLRAFRTGERIVLSGYVDARGHGCQCQERVRELSEDEWRSLLAEMEQARFWDLPKDVQHWGLDGETWAVEGRFDGRHHRVERWGPRWGEDGKEIARLGEVFLALAGLTW